MKHSLLAALRTTLMVFCAVLLINLVRADVDVERDLRSGLLFFAIMFIFQVVRSGVREPE